ncbi:MAG TPA: EamA family transporter [Clostridiales bacterium]|nr:EamA family transporter [Clostridiales bacterium]
MADYIFYPAIYIIGVFISSIAQILLKKSASTKAKNNIFTFCEKHCTKTYLLLRDSKNAIIRHIKKHKTIIIEYLNPKTIIAYFILFSATFLTIYSYKFVPLSTGPILGTTEYIFVAILSSLVLKEKITKQKFLGLSIIIIGIIIFSLKF